MARHIKLRRRRPSPGRLSSRDIRNFHDPRRRSSRLFAELVGTFFLVLAAAGAGMIDHAFPHSIGHAAAVTAPGLTVMAVILSMGKVSGAHLNPGVSIGFALRNDFPWERVPAYIVAQLAGAALAAWFLQSVVHVSAVYGSTFAAPGYTAFDACRVEAVLTFGLLTVILGTASGAQNVGVFGAIGVGAYISLAGLWASPLSGASMNTARTFGPDLVSLTFKDFWAYVVGPLFGTLMAVGAAFVLRGPGGGESGSRAAQGSGAAVAHPGKR